MSRSKDHARDAGYKGYYAGLDGVQLSENPYKLSTAAGTGVAWRDGWERGYAERRRLRMDCSDCDAISLQRITTQRQFCNIEFIGRVQGKKPYKVRCRKCKREWTTGAEYARHISGDAYQTQKKEI